MVNQSFFPHATFFTVTTWQKEDGLNRCFWFGFRESMNTFDHLSETFPNENCVLTNREILVEVTACVHDVWWFTDFNEEMKSLNWVDSLQSKC